jgi:hypothetical protein
LRSREKLALGKEKSVITKKRVHIGWRWLSDDKSRFFVAAGQILRMAKRM